jgi:membrane associated rhomboid family serine protease
MFGADLERTWGTQRFYTYFFLTGIGAGCINVLVKSLLDPHGLGTSLIPTIGASGAIYGVMLATALVFPDRQIWLIPFPVQIPMRIYVAAAIAIEFFMTLSSGSGDNVSHVTHLGGALVGYLYLRRGLFLYRARNEYLDWKRRRTRRKFEVYMREHKDEPPRRSDDHWVN